MQKKQKKTILATVHSVTTEVSDAANDLDKLLREMRLAPRAEKTTVSKVVEAAFSRLNEARVALAEIERLIKDDDDDY